MSGIYAITHLASGRRYIGSAKNFGGRWSLHRTDLAKGTHHSRYLQRAWDKYGPDAFRFEVLEKCAPARLLEREQDWLDTTRCYESAFGFNVCKVAGSSLGVKRTVETRAKLSAAKIGTCPAVNYLPKSPETRAKISAALMGHTNSDAQREASRRCWLGKTRGPMSAEQKGKLSASKRGTTYAPRTAEHTAKLWAARRANGTDGHDAETRARISAHRRGKGATGWTPARKAKIAEARRRYCAERRVAHALLGAT